MLSSKLNKIGFSLALFVAVLGVLGFSFLAHADTSVNVTTVKYMDGVQADHENANEYNFAVQATWNDASTGAGQGEFTLGPNSIVPYQTTSQDLTSGSSFTENEYTADGANASATCDGTSPYALVGYTSGDTLAEAQSATVTTTPPSFTNMTNNKYVIVWNTDCANPPPPPPPSAGVFTSKYINGVQATASNASSTVFTMNAMTNSTSSQFTLSATSATPYMTETDNLGGTNYTESEDTSGATTGASCDGTHPYTLAGYTSGDTMGEASSATPSMTAPSFSDMTGSKFVIVWNTTCANYVAPGSDNGSSGGSGTISGDVTGSGAGVLHVDSIDVMKNQATADGTFADGWEYIFNLTVPTNEPHVAMKFADWLNSSDASSTIPVAGNMRISSAQADATSTVMVNAANTYTTPTLNMVQDLDPSTPGIQVRVEVDVAVPASTENGTYTTNYGVQTN